MSVLRTLAPEGRRLLSDDLMRGLERLDPSELTHLLMPVTPRMPLGLFDQAVDDAMESFPPWSSQADAYLAPALHMALPLTRRVASESGIWRYLTTVHRPDYVAWRWEWRSRIQMQRRFWHFGTRPDSNAFCRLWWIAELTCEQGALDGSIENADEGYALTRRILGSQTLATAIFTRTLGHYRPAVRALAAVLGGETPTEVERVMKGLGRHLSVVPVESQSEEELVELVTSFL